MLFLLHLALCACLCYNACVEFRKSLVSWFSPSILRPSGLAATAFTHQALSSVLLYPQIFDLWEFYVIWFITFNSHTTSFRFNSSTPTKLLIPLFPSCKCDLWCLYILWCIAFHWIIIDLSETIFLRRINSPFPRSYELLNILPKMWNRLLWSFYLYLNVHMCLIFFKKLVKISC